MEPLHHLVGSSLTWSQPGLSRIYELRHGDMLFGRLTFQSIFGSLASVETAEGMFTFKRQGFLQPSVSVRRFGSDLDQGRMIMDGWHQGGMVHLAEGSRYQFVKMGFLHPEWTFLDATGRKLACMRVKWGFKYQGDVTIEPFGKDDRNLIQLLMVGMYAIILMNDEAATAANASASV